jgi:hypothetical protein
VEDGGVAEDDGDPAGLEGIGEGAEAEFGTDACGVAHGECEQREHEGERKA